jgi:magnesium and cobalt transporter
MLVSILAAYFVLQCLVCIFTYTLVQRLVWIPGEDRLSQVIQNRESIQTTCFFVGLISAVAGGMLLSNLLSIFLLGTILGIIIVMTVGLFLLASNVKLGNFPGRVIFRVMCFFYKLGVKFSSLLSPLKIFPGSKNSLWTFQDIILLAEKRSSISTKTLISRLKSLDQRIGNIMTAQPSIKSVTSDETVQAALDICLESGHSNLPVYTSNQIVGLVSLEDLLSADPQEPCSKVITTSLLIPETKPLLELIEQLLEQDLNFAVIIDEYGKLLGVVSIKDILQAIFSKPNNNITQDWIVAGESSLISLIDQGLELSLETIESNSIGGFIFERLGHLPKKGETLTTDQYSFEVIELDNNRIASVQIHTNPAI